MRNLAYVFVMFLCFLSPALAEPAEICETVNDVSNLWNDLANFLDEHSETGIDADAADEIDELIELLDEPTRFLGNALIELGNDTESDLGDQLLYELNDLNERERGETVDSLVEIIDSAVDTLDAIVDYCDSVN
ncbi:MAG: hypothetical protein JSU96_16275 [Acidobacteriota bacterium]|nr:MAG: hypothetical protein JSU96_16275 [Acidobacteriota bacterium]